MKRRLGILLAAASLVPFWTASAASTEFFVKQTGTDGLSCGGVGNDCREISYVIQNLAAASGDVIHVGPGSYSAITIDKSIEILAGEGETTTIFPGSTCGGSIQICVAAPADATVRIRGFTLSPIIGSAGIVFNFGGALILENISISGTVNTANGIRFGPNSGASELYISDSVFLNVRGSGAGIIIQPTGTASVTAVLDNVKLENNGVGLKVAGSGTAVPSIKVDLVDSIVSGNTTRGIDAVSPTNGPPIDVTIRNSTITGNVGAGVFAQGAAPSGRGSVIARFGGSNISNNGGGVVPSGAAVLRSLGGNFVDANGSGNGPFTIISPE